MTIRVCHIVSACKLPDPSPTLGALQQNSVYCPPCVLHVSRAVPLHVLLLHRGRSWPRPFWRPALTGTLGTSLEPAHILTGTLSLSVTLTLTQLYSWRLLLDTHHLHLRTSSQLLCTAPVPGPNPTPQPQRELTRSLDLTRPFCWRSGSIHPQVRLSRRRYHPPRDQGLTLPRTPTRGAQH